MEQIRQVIRHMISITQEELDDFLSACFKKTFEKKEYLSRPGGIPNEIFFIKSGILRLVVNDQKGNEHTVHFALENQFIADYASFVQRKASYYSLQALERLEVVVMPRSSIEKGYANLTEGEKLGRLIAEYYFIYQDNRIRDTYFRTAKERYDSITEYFPNIHNRVPQHMIASYLGITPIHLSRLKKETIEKI